MFQVMVVDDEPPFVRQLASMIRDMEDGIFTVHTAGNGMEALEYMEGQQIHLLITDIRMPVMDGLELIRRARQKNPELCSVIVSGYSDFQYARSAIREEVSDYLLKPISLQQVREVLQDVTERLMNARERVDTEVFQGLLGKSQIDSRRFAHILGGYRYQGMILQKGWFCGISRYENVEREEKDRIGALLSRNIGSGGFSYILMGKNLWLILLYDQDALAVKGILQEFSSTEKNCCYGVTDPSTDLNDIRKKLGELLEELGRKAKIQGCCDLCKEATAKYSETEYLKEISLMEQLIKAKAYERFLDEFQKMTAQWRRKEITQQQALKRLRRITQMIQSMAQERLQYDMILELERFSEEILSFDELCEAMRVFADDAFRQLNSRERSSLLLMEEIDLYIKEHLGEPILLTDICKELYLSQPYLSRVVRENRGMSLNEYVTTLKIREAKRLMKTYPELMVKNISEMLGYEDQRYFSRVFKNVNGYSPTDYMQKLKEG